MLTERRSIVLRNLINEFIATAVPVSSGTISSKFDTKISSATIRNELAKLEQEGYVYQPHTSAGRVPSVKGYRYYVETQLENQSLTLDEQRQIRHQFFQINKSIDDLVNLSATILSRMLHNVAIVTTPHVTVARVKTINLISLTEASAVMTLVFQDAGFSQVRVTFEEPFTQEELNSLSSRLTENHKGKTAKEIRSCEERLSSVEEKVTRSLLDMLDSAGERVIEDPHYDGLSQIMSQPEFVESERTKILMKLLEERALLSAVLSQAPSDEKLRIIIGSENAESELHDFSIILGRYGLSDTGSGVVGIVGPTRMAYDRTLPVVRYLSEIMSELLCELYR